MSLESPLYWCEECPVAFVLGDGAERGRLAAEHALHSGHVLLGFPTLKVGRGPTGGGGREAEVTGP